MKYPSVHYLETGVLEPFTYTTGCGLSAWRVRVSNFLPLVTCYRCKVTKQTSDARLRLSNLDMFDADNNHGSTG